MPPGWVSKIETVPTSRTHLMSENGYLALEVLEELGIGWDSGQPATIRTTLIKKISRAFPGGSTQQEQGRWLFKFYKSFEEIRQQRNTLVHRGKLAEADIQKLMLWLLRRQPAAAHDLGDLPVFTHWATTAAEAGLAHQFPQTTNIWPVIAEQAKNASWRIPLPHPA